MAHIKQSRPDYCLVYFRYQSLNPVWSFHARSEAESHTQWATADTRNLFGLVIVLVQDKRNVRKASCFSAFHLLSQLTRSKLVGSVFCLCAQVALATHSFQTQRDERAPGSQDGPCMSGREGPCMSGWPLGVSRRGPLDVQLLQQLGPGKTSEPHTISSRQLGETGSQLPGFGCKSVNFWNENDESTLLGQSYYLTNFI